MPRVFQLRTYDLPDVGDHLIHFTGRDGLRLALPPDINSLDPPGRLAQILHHGRLRANRTFGTGGRAIVALTESSKASVLRLISDGRYGPYGIGFSKQFIFDQGGGPVLYVRGDEWTAAEALPDPLRARIVRFWPGAAWEEGDPLGFDGVPYLPAEIENESQWLHEREWRVPNDVAFGWGDVKFLIVPSPDWAAREAHRYGNAYGRQYELHFGAIPVVAISETGQLLYDGSGIWRDGAYGEALSGRPFAYDALSATRASAPLTCLQQTRFFPSVYAASSSSVVSSAVGRISSRSSGMRCPLLTE